MSHPSGRQRLLLFTYFLLLLLLLWMNNHSLLQKTWKWFQLVSLRFKKHEFSFFRLVTAQGWKTLFTLLFNPQLMREETDFYLSLCAKLNATDLTEIWSRFRVLTFLPSSSFVMCSLCNTQHLSVSETTSLVFLH